MPGTVYSGHVDDLPRETRFNGQYQRTGLVMDSANMCFIWREPEPLTSDEDMNFPIRLHSHPCDMMFILLEGEYIWQTGEQRHHIKGGDFIYIPRDVPHGARNIGKVQAKALEIFAPIRTDYLYVAEHQLGLNQAPREADGSRVDDRSLEDAAASMGDMKLHGSSTGA